MQFDLRVTSARALCAVLSPFLPLHAVGLCSIHWVPPSSLSIFSVSNTKSYNWLAQT